MISARVALSIAFIGFACDAAAQAAVEVLPSDMRPIRVAGVGLRVADLERSRKFYTEVLGLKVAARARAMSGKVDWGCDRR